MIIIRPLIDVLGKIMKLPKNSYLDPTTLGSGVPSASNWLRGDGSWQPITPGPTIYGLFAQTSLGPYIHATTVETTLIGTGVGSLSVPANGFQAGDSFVAKMCGNISSANIETIHIRVKSNGNVIADAGVFTLNLATNKHFELVIDFTVTKIGGPGVAELFVNGQFSYNKNANNNIDGINFSLIDNTIFDTTTPLILNITAQWGSANINNSIQSQNFVLNKTY